MSPANISRKAFIFILVVSFLNTVGIGIVIPVLPYIVAQYTTDSSQIALLVGLLSSAYALCQFLAAPGLGILSDRFGRRPILLLCLIGSAIGYLLFGLGGSIAILFISRIVDGLTGGNISTIFAYIADLTEPKTRGKYYGMLGASMSFGFIIGPSLGGFSSHFGLSAPLYLAAAVTVLAIIWGYFALPESLHHQHRIDSVALHHLNPFSQLLQVLRLPLISSLFFSTFSYYLAFAILQGNSSVLTKDVLHWTPANVGILFTVIGINGIFVQGFLIRKLMPRFPENTLILWGISLVIIGYMGFALIPSIHNNLIPYLSAFILSLGSGIFEPAINGIIAHITPHGQQGKVQGASTSLQALTRIVGPLAGAFLYQFAWLLPYLLCITLSFVSIMLLTRLRPQLKLDQSPAPAQ